MSITITTFSHVPEFAWGYVKDIRVRWALEEAGLPYEVEAITGPIGAEDPYRDWQPFGQVPAYRDDEIELFESGAILTHLAGRSEKLAPADTAGRARVSAWLFAALNAVEPPVERFIVPDLFHAGEAWVEGHRPVAQELMEKRLASLSRWLRDREFVEGRFTAADIAMATVLRGLDAWPLADRFPVLGAYKQRCLDRPAFGRALEAQIATFRENMPEG